MKVFRRFKEDQSGATALIFGLAVIPLIGLAGAAVDYSRASMAQTKIQSAIDQAALSIVKLPKTATQASMDAIAKNAVESAFGFPVQTRSTSGITLDPPTVSRSGTVVNIQATGNSYSAFIQLLGISSTPIGASSQAQWSSKKIELALVLDNTGSMTDLVSGQRKIDALKTSAKQLLSDLRRVAKEADTVKVSLVPFSTVVKVDPATYRSQLWFRWKNANDSTKWNGLIAERYNDYQFSAAPPDSRITDSLYTPKMGSTASKLAKVLPLVSLYNETDYDTLVKSVEAMEGDGNTNVSIGAMWGLGTLTPNAPFAGPVPMGTKGVEKYMVVLTDGNNTEGSRNGAQVTDVGTLNTATTAACTAAKNNGVKIYTIRLLKGDETLLKGCASSPSMYFNVQSAGDLSKAFEDIVKGINGTRITS